ncbi:DUF3375 domain-containing protein [Mycetocola spongiae]|uniref:DUF3375 domain-containing protein n=1 Tax=Mycetocola spongiae TaxID=2859226 RepID=UPI001CF34637|nr:DUF3375 domain-containing protein [Mycetocola spongiae]UCR89655.1 DUF3375 domain-containing protein [Mycetocola spongiae]
MSEITAELARVREAFDKPTLRLLDRKWAPLVLAVFKTTFGRDRQSVHAERLHIRVDSLLADLASAGEEIPALAGRALCVQWMNDAWLYRSLGADGEESYSLTSHALEALSIVDGLAKDRALLSESRLTTILDTMSHWAAESTPDREARLARLDTRIEELTAERTRLAAGGEIPTASPERMQDGYANLINLIAQLPSDFKRVEESVAGMHRQIISDFRSEERPIVQVLDEYLAKTDELMSGTPEGRAFEGAFALLRDDELLAGLRRDIDAILEHPFSARLSPAERREFRGTVAVIRSGIDDVLSQRSRLTGTLREHIVNHDVVRDRQLETTLRRINQELETWMKTAPVRAAVPVELLPGLPEVGHLRERVYDPAGLSAPPPLEDVSEEAPEAPLIADIRTQGGPLLEDIRDALLSGAAEGASAGTLFNTLDGRLRRPVEIFGVLHLLTQIDALESLDGEAEEFHTVRPDHSTQAFRVPRVQVSPDTARALAEQKSTTETITQGQA